MNRLTLCLACIWLVCLGSLSYGQAAPGTAYTSFTTTIASNLTKLDIPITTNHAINSFPWGDVFCWDTGGGIFEVQIYPAAGGGADAKWFFQWDGPTATFTHLGSGWWGTEQNFAVCTLSVDRLAAGLAGSDVAMRLLNMQWGAGNNQFITWQNGAFAYAGSGTPAQVWVWWEDGVWVGEVFCDYQYSAPGGPTIYDRVKLGMRGRLVLPAVYEWVFTISHGLSSKSQTSYCTMGAATVTRGYGDPALTLTSSVGIWGGGFPVIESAVGFLPSCKWSGLELNLSNGRTLADTPQATDSIGDPSDDGGAANLSGGSTTRAYAATTMPRTLLAELQVPSTNPAADIRRVFGSGLLTHAEADPLHDMGFGEGTSWAHFLVAASTGIVDVLGRFPDWVDVLAFRLLLDFVLFVAAGLWFFWRIVGLIQSLGFNNEGEA